MNTRTLGLAPLALALAAYAQPHQLVVTVTPPGSNGNPANWQDVLRFNVTGGTAVPLTNIPRAQLADPASVTFRTPREVLIGNRHGNVLGQGSISRFLLSEDGLTFTSQGSFTTPGMVGVHEIAFNPVTGELFAATVGNGIFRFTFNQLGQPSPNGAFAGGRWMRGVVVHPNGQIVYTTGADSLIRPFRLNADGSVTEQPSINPPGASNLHFFCMHPLGNEMFVGDINANKIFRYRFDGAGNPVYNGAIDSPAAIDLAITPDGLTMYAGNHFQGGITVYTYNAQSDAWTQSSTIASPSMGGFAFYVPAAAPSDLEITAVSMVCGSSCRSEPSRLTATLSNRSGAAAPAGTLVRFYAGSVESGDILGEGALAAPLLSGQSAPVTLALPADYNDPRPITAVADPTNQLGEASELNNRFDSGATFDCTTPLVNISRCGNPLSAYLGAPSGTATSTDSIYADIVTTGAGNVGVDCAGSMDTSPVAFCDSLPLSSCIGLRPPASGQARVDFDLDRIREDSCGAPTHFSARVGLDNATPAAGGARFILLGDGVELARVEVASIGVGSYPISASIADVSTLSLITEPIGAAGPAVWGGAYLVAPGCCADISADGFIDFFDYDTFVDWFETGRACADFNHDGFLDFFDYDDFVRTFEAGC